MSPVHTRSTHSLFTAMLSQVVYFTAAAAILWYSQSTDRQLARVPMRPQLGCGYQELRAILFALSKIDENLMNAPALHR